MNEPNEEKLRELLRSAMPPVVDTELKHDLWPGMLRRLDESTVRMPWFDWLLLAIVPVWILLFPQAIPALLYHL
jgi:hypothetical protein